MNEPKLRLSLVVPGAQMLSAKEIAENPQNSHDKQTINFISYKKKGKKTILIKESIDITTRKSRTARQCISISEEAYKYMIDNKAIPSDKVAKNWSKYTIRQKLEYHFRQIAASLGAISFTYELLED